MFYKEASDCEVMNRLNWVSGEQDTQFVANPSVQGETATRVDEKGGGGEEGVWEALGERSPWVSPRPCIFSLALLIKIELLVPTI